MDETTDKFLSALALLADARRTIDDIASRLAVAATAAALDGGEASGAQYVSHQLIGASEKMVTAARQLIEDRDERDQAAAVARAETQPETVRVATLQSDVGAAPVQHAAAVTQPDTWSSKPSGT